MKPKLIKRRGQLSHYSHTGMKKISFCIRFSRWLLQKYRTSNRIRVY